MKKLPLYILFLLFTANNSFAQRLLTSNLVVNPGYEQYTNCPDNGSQIYYAYPWNDCVGGNGSSDYYNLCTTNPFMLAHLSVQLPKTGNGEAGIYMYGLWIQDNYREYLMGKLNTSLKTQKRYCGEYYTSLSNYCKGAVETMGMFFSIDTVLNYSGLFALQPQIENHKGIIKDTINWVRVNGSFIANGGEKHFTIGNFKDNLHTNYEELNYGFVGAYYFIDDVSVCECSFDINLGPDTSLCDEESLILYPNLPNASYTWQDSSHAATYEVKQPGTYWVRAYVADYDITTTDTIVITTGNESFCNPPLTITNIITPNGDSKNDNFQIPNAESYTLALQIYNRWGTLIYETTNYQNDFSCKECADGVYFYVLKAKSKRNGREKEYKGSLTIINA